MPEKKERTQSTATKDASAMSTTEPNLQSTEDVTKDVPSHNLNGLDSHVRLLGIIAKLFHSDTHAESSQKEARNHLTSVYHSIVDSIKNMCDTFAELSEWFEDRESHNEPPHKLFELAMELFGSYNAKMLNIHKKLLAGNESNRYLKKFNDVVTIEELLDRIVNTAATARNLHKRMSTAGIVGMLDDLSLNTNIENAPGDEIPIEHVLDAWSYSYKAISKYLDFFIDQKNIMNEMEVQRTEQEKKHLNESAKLKKTIEELTNYNALKETTLNETILVLQENTKKQYAEQNEKIYELTKDYENSKCELKRRMEKAIEQVKICEMDYQKLENENQALKCAKDKAIKERETFKIECNSKSAELTDQVERNKELCNVCNKLDKQLKDNVQKCIENTSEKDVVIKDITMQLNNKNLECKRLKVYKGIVCKLEEKIIPVITTNTNLDDIVPILDESMRNVCKHIQRMCVRKNVNGNDNSTISITMYDKEMYKIISNLETEQEPMSVEHKEIVKKHDEMKQDFENVIVKINNDLETQKKETLQYKDEVKTIQSVYHQIMKMINVNVYQQPETSINVLNEMLHASVKLLSDNLAQICPSVNATECVKLKYSDHSDLFSKYEKAIITNVLKRYESQMEVTTCTPGNKCEKSDPTTMEYSNVTHMKSATDRENVYVKLSTEDHKYEKGFNEMYTQEVQNVLSSYHKLMSYMGVDATVEYTQALDTVKDLQKKSIDVVKRRLEHKCVRRHDNKSTVKQNMNETMFETYENAIFKCIDQLDHITVVPECKRKRKNIQDNVTTNKIKPQEDQQPSRDISCDCITSSPFCEQDVIEQIEQAANGPQKKQANMHTTRNTSEAYPFHEQTKVNACFYVKNEQEESLCIFDHP